MRNSFKRTVVVVTVLCLAVIFSGCSKAKVPDTYNIDLDKYVKLGPYEGLEYEKADRTVTDEEVREEIEMTLSYNAERIEHDEGTVKEDSIVNIDYEGSVNGEVRDDMTSQGEDVYISDSGMIDGFAESIVGHNVGDTYEVELTFPEDYFEEALAGQPAVFKITVNKLLLGFEI